jgi:hypothetical protein
MKKGIQKVLGKTISGIVVAENQRFKCSLRSQMEPTLKFGETTSIAVANWIAVG